MKNSLNLRVFKSTKNGLFFICWVTQQRQSYICMGCKDNFIKFSHLIIFKIQSDKLVESFYFFNCTFGSITPDVLFNQETLEDLANYIRSSSEEIPIKRQQVQEEFLDWRIEGNESGKCLLLLPPLNTCSHIWEQQIHYFVRKGYRIFVPHYPGNAGTTFFDFDLNKLSDIIWKQFQSLANNPEKTNVFGWSLGGCLALLLVRQYPDLISNVVLVNTAAKFDRDLFSQSPQLRDELENKIGYLKQLFKDQESQAINLIGAGCSLDILKHYYDQLNQFNVEHDLKNIKNSCLVVFGEKDSVINPKDIESLLCIPKSVVEKFPSDGHFLPLTSPYKFNQVVERFIS